MKFPTGGDLVKRTQNGEARDPRLKRGGFSESLKPTVTASSDGKSGWEKTSAYPALAGKEISACYLANVLWVL